MQYYIYTISYLHNIISIQYHIYTISRSYLYDPIGTYTISYLYSTVPIQYHTYTQYRNYTILHLYRTVPMQYRTYTILYLCNPVGTYTIPIFTMAYLCTSCLYSIIFIQCHAYTIPCLYMYTISYLYSIHT